LSLGQDSTQRRARSAPGIVPGSGLARDGELWVACRAVLLPAGARAMKDSEPREPIMSANVGFGEYWTGALTVRNWPVAGIDTIRLSGR
jgi:hypothetical protein